MVLKTKNILAVTENGFKVELGDILWSVPPPSQSVGTTLNAVSWEP